MPQLALAIDKRGQSKLLRCNHPVLPEHQVLGGPALVSHTRVGGIGIAYGGPASGRSKLLHTGDVQVHDKTNTKVLHVLADSTRIKFLGR